MDFLLTIEKDAFITPHATPQEKAAYAKYAWFFPGITHGEAVEILKDKAVGTYLVRKSERPNTLTGELYGELKTHF